MVGWGKIQWRRDRLPTPVFLGFPCGSAGKESACNAGDLGSIPGLQRSHGEGKGYPRLPTPVFALGEFHGLYSPWGCMSNFSLHFQVVENLPSGVRHWEIQPRLFYLLTIEKPLNISKSILATVKQELSLRTAVQN